VVHWQGTSWSLAYELASEIEFKAVWGSAFSNVWAVGIDNVVAHFDGSGWSTVSFAPTEQVFAMGGSGPSDLWAATSDNGSGVTLQHWDGSRWSVSYTGTGLPMAIWAWGPNDAWATGWYGMGVLQWNGTSWSNTDAPTDYDFGAIWGSGPSDVWAVGSSGAVVHFDGSTWSSDSVTTSDLVGVAGSGPNDVWMLTAAGAILHHP
jgi:hypothetical protein